MRRHPRSRYLRAWYFRSGYFRSSYLRASYLRITAAAEALAWSAAVITATTTAIGTAITTAMIAAGITMGVCAGSAQAQDKPNLTIQRDCEHFDISNDNKIVCSVPHLKRVKKVIIQRDDVWVAQPDGKEKVDRCR